MDRYDKMDKIENKCLKEAKTFILCMNTPIPIYQKPIHNKCKYLFDNWNKCMLDANINIK